MSLFDRISQLTDENALLRSQLHDAQEQAKRDTETIGRLAKDKERMDWLSDNVAYVMLARQDRYSMEPLKNNGRGWQNGELREAIDNTRLTPCTL